MVQASSICYSVLIVRAAGNWELEDNDWSLWMMTNEVEQMFLSY